MKGIATIEILIALALGVVMLTGATLVSFGGQTAGLDTGLDNHGLFRAGTQISDAVASTTADWFADPLPWGGDLFYSQGNTVTGISPCINSITATTTWTSEKSRGLGILFETFVGSTEAVDALGGDCDPFPPGEWDDPASLVSVNINGQSDATDIDVNDYMVYLTTNPNAPNKDDFFIFEFDPVAVALIPQGVLDVDTSEDEGLMAVDVAGSYAFVAAASTTAQFQVIDVSDPFDPERVASLQLEDVDSSGSFPEGWSIYYYNDRVYVGTRETAGPEFHVIDVGNPLSPFEVGNGLELTTSVYGIFVSGSYAYLATSDNDSELCIVNISDPTDTDIFEDCEDVAGAANMKYNSASDQNGGGMYVLGDRVYLGLSRGQFDTASPHDFYVLNAADLANITLLDSADLGINGNTTNEGIIVRGGLAFIALDDPNTGLQIWDISNPVDIELHSTCTAINFSENTTGIDMDGDYLFTSNGSNAEIRVIYDQPSTCP